MLQNKGNTSDVSYYIAALGLYVYIKTENQPYNNKLLYNIFFSE